MTDPVARGEPPRSMGSRVAFVVVTAILWALVMEASADEPYVPVLIGNGASSFLGQHPGLVMLRALTLLVFTLITVGAPSYYRRRFAGSRWVRDVLRDETAVYAIGLAAFVPVNALLRSVVPDVAKPWDWTGGASTQPLVISRLGIFLGVCLFGGITSIFWAWLLHWTIIRVPSARPFTRMIPPND